MIKTVLVCLCGVMLGLPLAATASAAKAAKKPLHYPVHVDLNATNSDYESALRRQPFRLQSTVLADDPALTAVMNAGKRNLDWLIYMNAHRDVPLAFTKPGSLNGIPITAPKKYSGALVVAQYQAFLQTMPAPMRDVIEKGQPFTIDPPIAVEDYLKIGLAMDKLYQTALRWRLMLPYLNYYVRFEANDIRGYYFMKDMPDLEATLRSFDTMSADDKAKFTPWLVSECLNAEVEKTLCQSELTSAVTNKIVWDYHLKYLPMAKETFEDFFKISNPRPDLTWKTSNPNQADLLFKIPGVQAIQDFLSVNIEDEWKWMSWHLHLAFQPEADVHVRFEPGVTPHVNAIGGNEITMDQNAPLSEWDVQWTIRHEFGHVLGFPDCYVEYYDARESVMVSYQIDIENLMCARSGRFQEKHFNELKKAYLKN